MIVLAAAAILIFSPSPESFAEEARPWLCRDKPAVSSSKPTMFEARSEGKRRWRLFFMQFDPAGGHDGFTISSFYTLGSVGNLQGRLDAGRFFIVALYRGSNGHWLCPKSVVTDSARTGLIAGLSYSTPDSSSFRVKIKETSAVTGSR